MYAGLINRTISSPRPHQFDSMRGRKIQSKCSQNFISLIFIPTFFPEARKSIKMLIGNLLQSVGNACNGLLQRVLIPSIISSPTIVKRGNRIIYYRFPSETKRVRKHSLRKLLQREETKKILMKRILKGRHLITPSPWKSLLEVHSVIQTVNKLHKCSLWKKTVSWLAIKLFC